MDSVRGLVYVVAAQNRFPPDKMKKNVIQSQYMLIGKTKWIVVTVDSSQTSDQNRPQALGLTQPACGQHGHNTDSHFMNELFVAPK